MKRKKKNDGKFNAFFVERKIFFAILALFIFSLVFVGFRYAARNREEKIPETYYKYSGLYNTEVDDFSAPLAEPEVEKQEENGDTKHKTIEDLMPISCWGDSFTVAYSDSSVSYAGILAGQSQRIVYNIGSPADSAKTIAGRQGGVPLMTTPFIIPPDKTPVEITIDSAMGGRLDLDFSKNAGLNPCTIKGVEGIISNIRGTLYFTRSKSGQEVMVYEPEPIITRGMALRKDDISVFFFGSDSMINDADQLIQIYKAMVDYLGDNKQYLVMSPVRGDVEKLKVIEEKLEVTFGDKFLNTRLALCEDAQQEHDMYKIPSSEIEGAKNGIIPDSYFYESNYFSDVGAYAAGVAVNEKLKSLGYYADADYMESDEEQTDSIETTTQTVTVADDTAVTETTTVKEGN